MERDDECYEMDKKCNEVAVMEHKDQENARGLNEVDIYLDL